MNFITNKKDFKRKKLDELIELCLLNECDHLEETLKVWLQDQENSLDDYREKVLNIGSLVTGSVYKEDGSFYRLTGFILQICRKNRQAEWIENSFYPIYSEGQIDYNEYPLIFNGCVCLDDDHGFVENNAGYYIHFDSIIKNGKEVRHFVEKKRYDLNKIIKSKGLYLNI